MFNSRDFVVAESISGVFSFSNLYKSTKSKMATDCQNENNYAPISYKVVCNTPKICFEVVKLITLAQNVSVEEYTLNMFVHIDLQD